MCLHIFKSLLQITRGLKNNKYEGLSTISGSPKATGLPFCGGGGCGLFCFVLFLPTAKSQEQP